MRRNVFLFAALFVACTSRERPPPTVPSTEPPPQVVAKGVDPHVDILGPDASPVTIERAAKLPELGWNVPRGRAFSPDGKLVTYLASEHDDQELSLFAYDLAAKTTRVLLRAADLAKDAKLSREEELRRERQRVKSRGVTDYAWAKNADVLVTSLGGDLYVASSKGAPRRVTETPEPEIDPKLCDSGREVAFARGRELYAIDLATNKETALTKGAPEGVTRGQSDFNGQEEFDEPSGFFWSPDCAKIAYLEVDERKVETVPVLGYRKGTADLMMQKYPLTGGINPVVEARIVDVKTKKSTAVQLGDKEEKYLLRFTWSPDSKSLYLQALTRNQQKLTLEKVDAATGKSKVLVTETEPTWVEPSEFVPLAKSDRFLWTAERGGHTHLELRDAATGEIVARLTKGDWDVARVVGVDETKGVALFEGTFDGPLDMPAYSVPFAGGAPRRLTPEKGVHQVNFDEKARAMIDLHSAADRPPKVAVRAEDGAVLADLPSALDADADKLGVRTPEFVTVKGPSGDTLYGQILKPRNMLADKRYPVVTMVYGGPGVRTVEDAWHPYLLWQHLADRGVVVFQLDNRGSSGRGPAFAWPIYKRMGVVELEDQLAGRDWLEKQPFVDKDRIAIYGHSYGGFMAALAMLKAPGKYKVGISGSPVTDFRYYDSGYTERYMGMPRDNVAGYDGADLALVAGNLQGKLLLLHGMMDENVHFANSGSLIDALIAANKPFDVMVFPGERHGYRDKSARVYAFERVVDYLVENL